MTVELERVSIGGVWQWQAVSGGGGGGVSEITSDDESVTITNPSGPTVDLSVSGGSQTFRVLKATVGFADLVDQTGGLGRTAAPVYTLAAGEQLLIVLGRVTEAFDDSGVPILYVSSAAAGAFGLLVGASVGPGLNTAADGVVDIADPAGVSFWADNPAVDPVEAQTPPLALYVFGSTMEFDGATGIVEFTFYVATPEAL